MVSLSPHFSDDLYLFRPRFLYNHGADIMGMHKEHSILRWFPTFKARVSCSIQRGFLQSKQLNLMELHSSNVTEVLLLLA